MHDRLRCQLLGKLHNNSQQHYFNGVGVRVFDRNFCTGDRMRGSQQVCLIQRRIAAKAGLDTGGEFGGGGDLRFAQNLEQQGLRSGHGGAGAPTAICLAAEVNDGKSRVSADAYKRRESRWGKRTVASRCADSRLRGLPAYASLSRLSRWLSAAVEDAILTITNNTHGEIG